MSYVKLQQESLGLLQNRRGILSLVKWWNFCLNVTDILKIGKAYVSSESRGVYNCSKSKVQTEKSP